MDMRGALEGVEVGAPVQLVRRGHVEHGVPQMLANPHGLVGVARPVVEPQPRGVELPGAVGAVRRADPGVHFRLRAPDLHAPAPQQGAQHLEVARPREVGAVCIQNGVDLVAPLGVWPVTPPGRSRLQEHGLAHDVALDLHGVVEVVCHRESGGAGGVVERRVVLAPWMLQPGHVLLPLGVPQLHVDAVVLDGPHADGLAHAVPRGASRAQREVKTLAVRVRHRPPTRLLPEARVLDEPPLVAVPLAQRAAEGAEQGTLGVRALEVDAPVVPGLERAARRPGILRGGFRCVFTP
jgi:hypothetical protein